MFRHSTALKIEEIIQPSIEGLNYELLGVEFKPSRYGSLLRIYIDSPNGIGIEDCERVSRQVSTLLDVHDPIQTEYNLEVSSPGEDRPLFTLAQIQKHSGERAKLVLSEAHQGRRRFTGVVNGVSDDKINITLDDQQTFEVPFALLTEAKLAPLH